MSPKFLSGPAEKRSIASLVEVPQVAAEGLGIHDVAADEMPFMPAAPLQIEEIVAAERERAQQDDVGVHPQPAMLVEHGVAEDVAEIADLRAGDDALEQALGQDVGGLPQLDPVRPQKFELLRRIAPHPDRVPGRAHRCGRGDEARVLRGVGQHLVKTVDLRQAVGAVEKRRDPRVEFAREPPPLGRVVDGGEERRQLAECLFG